MGIKKLRNFTYEAFMTTTMRKTKKGIYVQY